MPPVWDGEHLDLAHDGAAVWLDTDGNAHRGRWEDVVHGYSRAGMRLWRNPSEDADFLFFKCERHPEYGAALVLVVPDGDGPMNWDKSCWEPVPLR